MPTYFVTSTRGFKKPEEAEAFAAQQSQRTDQRVCVLVRKPGTDPRLVTLATYEGGKATLRMERTDET